MPSLKIILVSLIMGVLSVFSFAPYSISGIIIFTIAIMYYLWQQLPAKQAAISAWFFGLGIQCFGVSWLYYSIHTHGDAPPIFAIFLIFLLCSVLSIFYASSVYIVNRFFNTSIALRLIVLYPTSWMIFEILQNNVLTGFSWMQYGYTQIDTMLSGYAPLIGSHGVSWAVSLSAGMLVYLFMLLTGKLNTSNNKVKVASLVVVAFSLLWAVGATLKTIQWTEKTGKAIKVSLIQGNIAQQDKWKSAMKRLTLERYKNLTLAQKDVDLIVWPETAVPDYWHGVADYTRQLREQLKKSHTDLLLGIFIKNDKNQLLNSVLSIHGGVYSKRHLVPLGEYIPLRFLIDFFNQFVKIPMSDLVAGAPQQKLIEVAKIKIGVSICFEEAFSREIQKDLPQAKLLINMSNDAWFEDSMQMYQHHVISRMRALESGRYMIRATNTGITSIINAQGNIVKQLPPFKVAVLKGKIQPYKGATPFVYMGNMVLLSFGIILLLLFFLLKKNREDKVIK